MLAHSRDGPDAPGSEDVHEDVFKTPMERRHITFDDSDHEEFATPLEGPLRNPLESTKAEEQESKEEEEKEEEEEEDSDDEAPPEAISSHAAGANIAKASQAAAKAAQQYGHTQIYDKRSPLINLQASRSGEAETERAGCFPEKAGRAEEECPDAGRQQCRVRNTRGSAAFPREEET
jgi:outer membrane biosynthesis protein TonB